MKYLINLQLKYEEEGNNLVVDLMKLIMNSLYGQSIRKDIEKKYNMRFENWLRKIKMIGLLIINHLLVVIK